LEVGWARPIVITGSRLVGVKQYPHDGQLGLGMMMYAFNGGLIAGFILFVAGIVWTVKTSKGANNPLVK
jgi:hypothetical protein